MKIYFISFCVIFFIFFGCVDKNAKDDVLTTAQLNHSEDYYLKKIQSLDTIPFSKREDFLQKILTDFDDISNKDTIQIYNIIKSIHFSNIKNRDSVILHLNRIKGKNEIKVLEFLYRYKYETYGSDKISYQKIDSLYRILHIAENHNSKFTHLLYDELARAYFQNEDSEKALEYTKLYFENTPFKNNEKVMQRYFDIRVIIAIRLENLDEMLTYMDKARELAFHLNDTIAIARAYDYKSQYFMKTNQFSKSVKAAQRSFAFHKKTNLLSNAVYHNLAFSFLKDKQPDSAIYYLNAGQKFLKENDIPSDISGYYRLLKDVYLFKKDYETVVKIHDTLLNLTHVNQIKVKNDKIAELELKLKTEKKDNDIKVLIETNSLNQQVILQQKWLLIIGGLVLIAIPLFIYNTYSRKLLKEKNEKLEIDKKRYLLEQKARQSQLNPHFIYNAIANMQGLIMTDKKMEANVYLVALSKYIRDVLELNRQEFVNLDDKINAIENYLKLQQMRYENVFDYKININIQSEDLLIPPMIVQPFIENSIEHGFKNIEHKGLLEINIEERENQLYIKILDNGSGKGVDSITGKKSLSRIITQERFDLIFNQDGKRNAFFEARPFNENGVSGYIVEIFLPIIKS